MIVYCIFERDVDDSEKGTLLQIFEESQDALDYIMNHKDEDVFWERWIVTSHALSNVRGKKE